MDEGRRFNQPHEEERGPAEGRRFEESPGEAARRPEDEALAASGRGEATAAAGNRERPEDIAPSLGRSEAAPADPRAADEADLRKRFREAERQLRRLREQQSLGLLDEEQLRAALRQWMILDAEDIWWMLGLQSGRWYRHVEGRWQRAEPPVILDALDAEEERERGDTGAGLALDLEELPGGEAARPAPGRLPHDGPHGRPHSLTRSLLAEATGSATQQWDDVPQYELPPPGPLYRQAVARQRARRRRRISMGVILGLGGSFLAGVLILLFVLFTYNDIVSEYRAEIEALAHYAPAQSVRVLDAEGALIAELTGGEGGARQAVGSLGEISPYLLHAIVSLENERFFEDPGWDLLAIGRAVTQNLLAGQITSGASTITQQLARMLILQDATVSAERKLREIVVAAELARRYDKNDLLLLYLNEVNFGNLAYGAQAAAQLYFGTSARDVNLPQAAMLAGMLQAPAFYDPIGSAEGHERTMERALTVMRQMVDVGCLPFTHDDWASEGPFCVGEALRPQHPEYDEYAGTAPLPLLITLDEQGIVNDGIALVQFARLKTTPIQGRPLLKQHPHVVDLVLQQVEAAHPGEMYARGFTIHTTIDGALQAAAQAAIEQGVARHEFQGVTNGAALVSDPATGAVLAMVGSVDYVSEERRGQVNNTIQYHQPGSAIKPLVYAAALEGVDRGGDGQIGAGDYLTASTVLWDVPMGYEEFSPRNFDNRYHGPVTLRTALQASYNIPVFRAYAYIGNEAFVRFAERLGIQFLPESEFNLTSAVGSNEVRMWDMNEAFGAFASDGVWRPLHLIRRITDHRGEEVAPPFLPEERQVISPALAYLMQDILSDNPARAAAFGIDSALYVSLGGDDQRRMVAAKSGTTEDARDLWTVGFSDGVVVSVWLGDVDNAETQVVAASLAAAPVWNELMRAALQQRPPQPFQPPAAGIGEQTVCTKTGTAVDGRCLTQHREWFLTGAPPPPPSTAWLQEAPVDAWTGRRANEACLNPLVQRRYLQSEDPWVRDWLEKQAAGQQFAREQGLELPLRALPTGECDGAGPQPTVRLTEPAAGDTVRGLVTLRGVVAEERFDSVASYTLSVAAHAPGGEFSVIRDRAGQEQGPFLPPPSGTGNLLGSWDTTRHADGEYTLRLHADATAEYGGSILVEVPVTVRNGG
ncbi:MAG: transglycosylase domain-containing protein [Anaerolineaceae bacterium]|nr:transglycosylase domain-containing protein [Anaerolineaceae bacterium]